MANIFRVTLSQILHAQTIQNVIHFVGPSSDPLQMSTLADEVVASWVSQVRTTQPADILYFDIGVRLLESQFPTFHKSISLQGTAFQNDSDIPFVAVVWRLRGNVLGRKGRGRIYLAGYDQAISHKGLINSPSIIEWQNRQQNILGVFGPNGSSQFRLVICSSKPPFNPVDVVSMDVNPRWCTQRRRNIGIGI